MAILCTLFNTYYLDKGIVLYDSLERVSQNFKLYILAMDERCYEVLCDLKKPNLVPVRLEDFENEELKEAKKTRSFGDYCCTCSSNLIKFILERYGEKDCTYIDADMCFYSDPDLLIEELYDKGASALVVSHRFDWLNNSTKRVIGRYCVEFNTFVNDEKGRGLLNHWAGQCIERCDRTNDGIHYGDQKYTDEWVEKYDFVVETSQIGAGVAPWNVRHYKWVNPKENGTPYLLKFKGEKGNLIFYHFENLRYLSKDQVYISAFRGWQNDSRFIYHLYEDYLKRIDSVKSMLRDKYGIDIIITSHPALKEKKKSTSRFFVYLKQIIPFLLLGFPTKLFQKKNIIDLTKLR